VSGEYDLSKKVLLHALFLRVLQLTAIVLDPAASKDLQSALAQVQQCFSGYLFSMLLSLLISF
jgi:hypothetical protein